MKRYAIFGTKTHLKENAKGDYVKFMDVAQMAKAATLLLAACKSAKAWLEYCDMADTAQHARLADAIRNSVEVQNDGNS